MKRAFFLFIFVCCGIAVAESVAADSRPSSPVSRGTVYLKESREWCFLGGDLCSVAPLARELVRQAVLLAAREELGLTTRDANLGDPMPAEKENLSFDIVAPLREPLQVDLVRGSGPQRVVFAHQELPSSLRLKLAAYQNLTELEETHSRGQFVEALKKAGFTGQPQRRDENVAVPKAIERLLGEMNFLSQFRAVRELHQLIHDKGESTALLGALSRGYANLGVLTEFHWAYAHKVFKARSLLYAQRLLAHDPTSPVARWHRAYAAAMSGVHFWALADLEEADKLCRAMPEKNRPAMPPWATLISPFCRYDVEELSKHAKDRNVGRLGVFLRFLAVASMDGRTWPVQTAIETLDSLPECYRVHDTLCELSGVATLHGATLAPIQLVGKTIYRRIASMSGLPQQVAAVLLSKQLFLRDTRNVHTEFDRYQGMEREFFFRRQLLDALCGSGWALGKDGKNVVAADDAGEPSWPALGSLIREMSFVQVFHRARFEREAWAVSPDEWLAKSQPLVEGHRYKPFLDTFAWSEADSSEAWTRAAKVDVSGAGMAARSFFKRLANSPNEVQRRQLLRDQDRVSQDLTPLLGMVGGPTACAISRMTLEISPYSPSARTTLVRFDWKAIQPQVAKWEKEAEQYPELLAAFADRYAAAGRNDDAERNLKKAVKIVPGDLVFWRQLANLYKRLGLTEKWLATLEEYLQKPDYGLGHFAVEEEIANYFIFRQEWNKALPHAEAAAQCYSAWGLLCGARCQEGLQHWDKAEAYFRAVTERYQDCSFAWYFFCRRTGHGDVDAARKPAKAFVEMGKNRTFRPAVGDLILFHLLEKQAKKALEVTETVVVGERPNFFDLLWKAVTAELAGEPKKRDLALQQLKDLAAKEEAEEAKKDAPKTGVKETGKATAKAAKKIATATLADKQAAALAEILLQDLAKGGKGQIDDDKVDKLVTSAPPELAAWLCYIAGQYLDGHGNRPAAERYWKRCVGLWPRGVPRTLSGAMLVERHAELPVDEGKTL